MGKKKVKILDEKEWINHISSIEGMYNMIYLESSGIRHRRKQDKDNQAYYLTVPKGLVKSGVLSEDEDVYLIIVQKAKKQNNPLLNK